MKSYTKRQRNQRRKEMFAARKQRLENEKKKNAGECTCSHEKSKNVVRCNVIPENKLFCDVMGTEIMLVMTSDQLNILGQTFRPIFTGRVAEVTDGYITLDPVIIKMNNAPFYKFPTPLSFPIERITYFTPFDSRTRIPIP